MPFKKGESGNPAGRPKGTGRAARYRDMLDEHIEAIIGKVIDLAKAGDMQAIKVCIDRVFPALKAVEMPVPVTLNGTLAEKGEAILRAVAAGELGVEQAAKLLQGIASQAKVVEEGLTKKVEALAERIEELEGRRVGAAKIGTAA